MSLRMRSSRPRFLRVRCQPPQSQSCANGVSWFPLVLGGSAGGCPLPNNGRDSPGGQPPLVGFATLVATGSVRFNSWDRRKRCAGRRSITPGGELAVLGERLAEANATLRATTEWLVRRDAADANNALAGATAVSADDRHRHGWVAAHPLGASRPRATRRRRHRLRRRVHRAEAGDRLLLRHPAAGPRPPVWRPPSPPAPPTSSPPRSDTVRSDLGGNPLISGSGRRSSRIRDDPRPDPCWRPASAGREPTT